MLLNSIVAVRDEKLRRRLLRALDRRDVLVNVVDAESNLWKDVSTRACDVIILSQGMFPKATIEEIQAIKDLPEKPIVVILSESATEEERAQFLATGFDLILPTQQIERSLGKLISSILGRRRLAINRDFPAVIEAPKPLLDSFVAHSLTMNNFLRLARQVVRSDATVLILGETGVGKERLARTLHNGGSRSNKPFIVVNCGALPENLFESELFGHDEGAFTGATRVRRGCFELAHSGTIFLDEIGEMPLHLQVKLLRVLDNREMQRIGSEILMPIDVRIMAATNRSLAKLVQNGEFRKDLYYRLNVVTLEIPPLRERVEDIPELANTYIAYLGPRIGCSVTGISPQAMRMLCDYAWPGNVRELFNVLERAILLCETEIIDTHDLSLNVSPLQEAGPKTKNDAKEFAVPELLPSDWLDLPIKDVRDHVFGKIEYEYIKQILKQTKGRIGQAAERCGLNERALYTKMKQYGLSKEDFK